MLYQSTRGDAQRLSGAEAIVRGLSNDGGLFVPESVPDISNETIQELVSKPYYERAAYIMGLFLSDFSNEELTRYSRTAYSEPGFDHAAIAPLYKIDNATHFMELWHGATCAFKDIALQVMPHLLTASLRKTGENRDVCILVATSGDTGKAALEGFRDVPGIKIMVFYPQDGVSEVQKLQMITQRGDNVNVAGIPGNFDDAQTGVKSIFSDKKLNARLDSGGYILSSANSINWGRLVPQVAYYFSAYCDLLGNGEIKPGEKINFCVPTGNFGNILAAFYARRMGLPIAKLICASNRNDVLSQFINTGVYDRKRKFFTTVSPSMDILVSSNLERLLFELSDKDGGAVASYMSALSDDGRYEVPTGVHENIKEIFASGFCSEEDTLETIADTFNDSGYLTDTHTAVAYKALKDYRRATGDRSAAVVVSTASAFKFCESVLEALGRPYSAGGVSLIDTLSAVTGSPIPAPLAGLGSLTPRFPGSIGAHDMKSAVTDFLLQSD